MRLFCFEAGGGWAAAAFSKRGLYALVLLQESPEAAQSRLAALLNGKGIDLDPAVFAEPRGAARREALALARQIRRYFSGREAVFSVRLDWSGYTPFQTAVLEAIRSIPYGQTRTYAQVAEAVGVPRGARAVGAAAAKNRTPLVVPCHRVVAAGGRLGGFSCGAQVKLRLLAVEGWPGLSSGRYKK